MNLLPWLRYQLAPTPRPVSCGCAANITTDPEDHTMNNEDRAEFGNAAIQAGSPDFGKNGDDFDGLFTDAGDAICNILHALYLHPECDEISVNAVWDRAWLHFEAEAISPDDIEQAFQEAENDG